MGHVLPAGDGGESVIPHLSGSWQHTDDPGEPHTGKPRLSVTDLEAAILTAMVRGSSVIEIGTGLGVSTRALASSAAAVHTVDIDPWVHETIWPYLPDNVITHETVESLPATDAVFIDGDHTTFATAQDIELAHRKARRLILCHDASHEMVAAAFDDKWTIIPTEHGIGVRWL